MNANEWAWVEPLLSNRKYRRLHLERETIEDLARQCEAEGVPPKLLEKAVREKLHHVVAPYLETIDYEQAINELQQIPAEDRQGLQRFARAMLAAHTSTAERLPILSEFYAVIGQHLAQKPQVTILDLACALNPLALPWMGLPQDCRFLAYDLHGARIQLLNLFFEKYALNARAYHQDILARMPQQEADAAFFFKEAHRFEQRRKGSTRDFLQRLPCKLIFLSLPAVNMTGRHDLRGKHTRLVENAIAGMNWTMESYQIATEILFIIRK